MKKCPKCNRTYADDGFTFCLEDGALLSAPFDPAKENPVRTIRSSGPSLTAVLPKAAKLPPTVASPKADPEPQLGVATQDESQASSKRSRLKPVFLLLFLGIPILLVLLYLGLVYLLATRR
ncbi:MAG TPA: hypothetical protein VHQ95_18150 [Pyrinomonadaceae bacterium]|jgi:hypothetical protein|nr:hypothetical protein [Pyrinomonadaceae bacterium]